MPKNKILIITHSNDNHCVAHVSELLKESGAEVFRMNSDRYPAEAKISGSLQGGTYSYELQTADYKLNISEITAVWYRRMHIGGTLSKFIAPRFIGPSVDESKATFLGVLDTIPAFVMDSYMKHRYAENKFNQLKIAHSLGMTVPDTLMTNDAFALKKFHASHGRDIISKMQHSFALYDDKGTEMVVFTNKVTREHLREAVSSLQFCPMKFQPNLHKLRELRVTVVGNKIFSAAVDSQKLKDAQLDWRREGVALLWEWYPFELPKELQKQILKLMDAFQLNYGALDFIQTKDGKLHFLEVNSGGEYYWLDVLFKHEISLAISEVLTGKAKRREGRFPKY